jgi:cell wall-associated NlpC family hydrolase
MPVTYAIAHGDTLLSIAYQFGSSVEAIRLASSLADADELSNGQVLVIPPARSVLHPVDANTTLAEISEAFNVNTDVLAAYNGVAPVADGPLDREVVILPAAVLGPTAFAPAPGATDGPTYKVVEGDTILGIAARLGVEATALVNANGITNSNRIVVGDELTVPLWSRPARQGVSADAAALIAASEATRSAERPAPVTYAVEPGDTLHGLADRFGLDVYTLVNNNNMSLSGADLLSVGRELTILPVSGLMYTVERGDTLSGIAQKFQVDLGPVIDFNYLEDADSITVGKELILPGGIPLPPPPPPAPVAPASGRYQVGPGDSVLSIAQRFGVTSADIVAANGLRSADRISIGDSLRIVSGAAALAPAARSAPAAPAARPAAASQTVTRNLPVPQPQAQPAPVAPSAGGGSVVSIAMQHRGARYVWGGTTPAGFDCSGFVYYVMNRAGKPVSRGMWGQYNAGSHPGRGALQPGDMVFFQNTYMAGLSHNGIYIGGGQFIHASTPGSGVIVSSLSESYWASRWFGATRV